MLNSRNEAQDDIGPKNGSNGEEEDDESSDDDDLGSPIFKNYRREEAEPGERIEQEPADAEDERDD